MGFYADRVVPQLVRLAMRQAVLTPYRRRLIANASGRVLEIGVGSGENLPHYAATAERVIGLDPSAKLLSLAREMLRRAKAPVELVEASAEAIPLADASVDTVVAAWTLCSIPDSGRALREVRRVLKHDGRLLFVEHGRSDEEKVARWQDRLTPIWRRLAGGCHLNRPVRRLVEDAGFRLERVETGYMEGPRPMTFTYEGIARRG
jgi:ubiquinone/menaquinone biosynthesis C-methylase UbiE